MGIYAGIRSTEQHQETASAVNQLFTTSLSDVSGQSHPLAQWRGKTLVVNFWATWCHPCVEEIPELSALQNTVAQKNIQIIGIGIDSASNIAAFSKERKISYPLYIGDTKGVELAKEFGNQAGGLPFTVLIDKDGHVKKTYLGRLKLSELKQELDLR
jgi:thiol-disulfide isomerase/thioredoxin